MSRRVVPSEAKCAAVTYETTPKEFAEHKPGNLNWCLGCCSSCVAPQIMACVCCCFPSVYLPFVQQAGLWTVKNTSPESCCQCFRYYADIMYDCNFDARQAFQRRYEAKGKKDGFFTIFNKVYICDHQETERLLTTDQPRGPFLGATDFSSHVVENARVGGRDHFLLAMDGGSTISANDGKPKVSDHDAFYAALTSITASSACLERCKPSDPIMAQFLANFRQAIQGLDRKTIYDKLITDMIIRCLHWGMFELDLSEAEVATLSNAYGSRTLLSSIRGSSLVFGYDKSLEAYASLTYIYLKSPIIREWLATTQFNNLTREGLVAIITRIFTFAAVLGPLATLNSVLLNPHGVIPHNFQMPVQDREKMRLVILETMRLVPPVLSSAFQHKCPMSLTKTGQRPEQWQHFPAGVPVCVSFFLAGRDEQTWSDAAAFKPYERTEQLWGNDSVFMGFNSVGFKGPRRCPGADASMEVMISVVSTVFADPLGFDDDVDEVAEKGQSMLPHWFTDPSATIQSLKDDLMEQTANAEKDLVVWSQLSPTTIAWLAIAKVLVDNDKRRVDAAAVKRFYPKLSDYASAVEFCEIKTMKIPFLKVDEDERPNKTKGALKAVMFAQMLNAEKSVQKSQSDLIYIPTERDAVREGREKFGNELPLIGVHWDELESDVAMAKLCFSGLGQAFLQRVTNHSKRDHEAPAEAFYEVDLSIAANYKVRERYEPYGAVMYFSRQRVLLGVWWCSRQRLETAASPGADWAMAKAVFKSTLITVVTLKSHLFVLHFTVSNSVAVASRLAFEPTHPIRRLLKPHTYYTASINHAGSHTLVPKFSLAYKVFAFHRDSWENAAFDLAQSYQFQTFPQEMAQKGMTEEELMELPLAKDGLELYAVLRRYVSAFVAVFYESEVALLADAQVVHYWRAMREAMPQHVNTVPEQLSMEALVDQITTFMFAVTAGHELYGAIVEYLVSPNFLPSKVGKNGPPIADADSFYISLALISLTGNKQPAVVNGWSHLHRGVYDEEQEKKVMLVLASWQKELRDLGDAIDGRNMRRAAAGGHAKEFRAMNPHVLECSVSV